MVLGLWGCSGGAPNTIGLTESRLQPCPASPNCVASEADDSQHRIAPFRFTGEASEAWNALKTIVAGLPRTIIITEDGRYLHAEARSLVFRFVDDLEFHLRPDDDLIAIRSAARTGRSDFGVNADRIEVVRAELQAKGLLR